MAKKENKNSIPQHEIDSLARALLPAIQAFFESEEGQKEFAEWKAEKAKRQTPQLNIQVNYFDSPREYTRM